MNSCFVIVVTALLLMLAVGRAHAGDKEQARKHFEAGIALLKVENYTVAAAEFERAVELYPTKTGLFNLASCYRALGLELKALEVLFKLRLDFGNRLDDDLAAAVAAMESELRAAIASLRIKVNVKGALLTLDGKSLGKSPLGAPQLLKPGEHEVEVSAPGYTTKKRKIELGAGDEHTAIFKLTRDQAEPSAAAAPTVPDPDPAQPENEGWVSTEPAESGEDRAKLSPLFWVGVAGSAAAGITAGVLWGVTGARSDDYDSHRSDYLELDQTSPDYFEQENSLFGKMEDARSDAQTFNRAAVAMTIVAGALVAGTLSVLAIDLTSGEEPTEVDDVVRVIPAPGGVAVTF